MVMLTLAKDSGNIAFGLRLIGSIDCVEHTADGVKLSLTKRGVKYYRSMNPDQL